MSLIEQAEKVAGAGTPSKDRIVDLLSALAAQLRRRIGELDAATSFTFRMPTSRLGDYVMVDYNDENDSWELSVHTCETKGLPVPTVFSTRDEAITEARKAAAASPMTAPETPADKLNKMVDDLVARTTGTSPAEKARNLAALLLGESAGRDLDRQECGRLRRALDEMTADRDNQKRATRSRK